MTQGLGLDGLLGACSSKIYATGCIYTLECNACHRNGDHLMWTPGEPWLRSRRKPLSARETSRAKPDTSRNSCMLTWANSEYFFGNGELISRIIHSNYWEMVINCYFTWLQYICTSIQSHQDLKRKEWHFFVNMEALVLWDSDRSVCAQTQCKAK